MEGEHVSAASAVFRGEFVGYLGRPFDWLHVVYDFRADGATTLTARNLCTLSGLWVRRLPSVRPTPLTLFFGSRKSAC